MTPNRRGQVLRLAAALLVLGTCLAVAAWAGSKIPGNAQRALTAFYLGHYKQSIEEYSRLLDSATEKNPWAEDLAAALMADGQYGLALKVLERHKLFGLRAVEAGIAAGDFASARKYGVALLKSDAPPPQTRIYLGLIDYMEGRFAEAAEQLWRAKDGNPKQGTLHLMLGRSFDKLATRDSVERDYFASRARQEYRRAIAVDPSLWQVHRDLALLAERSEEPRKALRHWSRVKSFIGNAEEVRLAIEGLNAKLPTPTVTATPEAVVLKPAPKAPVFDPIEVAPWTPAKSDPKVDVGLGNALNSLVFGCTGEWRAKDHRGHDFWKGLGKKGYRIEKDEKGRWWLKSWDGRKFKRLRKKIIVEPVQSNDVLAVFDLYQTSGYFWSEGRKKTRYYRGQLEIVPSRKTVQLINPVSLEEYLISVVPGEMPALWPMEALKTQVVVARTDTLLRRGTHRKQGYDVCNNAHCAMYRGVLAEHPRAHQAVLETRGLVIRQENGKLHPAFYSHSCGGATQSHEEAWWKNAPEPETPGGIYDMIGSSPTCRALPLRPGEINAWLSDSPHVFCNTPEYSAPRNFRWVKVLTREELSAVLDRRYGIGTLQELRILERSPSAYVRAIMAVGDHDKTVVRGDRIRSALGGIRSNLFTVVPVADSGDSGAPPRAWLIWGGGWGHGVGLCQVGAGQMGREGYSFEEILRHYFPEGTVEAWH